MAAIYYKFKSAKDYDSIPNIGHFISVDELKERIFASKHMGRGTDFDLIVTNAQTNEEYLDGKMLIAANTCVVVHRVPGLPRRTIVMRPAEPKVETEAADQLAKSNALTSDSSVLTNLEASDFDDEFGSDPFDTIPEVSTKLPNIQDPAAASKADEDSKIKALVESSSFDWQRQAGVGYVLGKGGRYGRSCGRGFGFQQRTPPEGYICHRCKIPGHFIQHCPTNDDPNFDIKKVKPPTGIPISMLEPTPDGLYALPSGTSVIVKPNDHRAAFEKEMKGLSSTRSMVAIPPELHCPLCNEVMKNAVFTSKCCYRSFCDKCIRDCIISKSMCFCEAKNVLVDDLLPNTTVRDTINRVLESDNSTIDTVGSDVCVQDMESALCVPLKMPSPIQTGATKEEQKLPSKVEVSQSVKKIVDGNNASDTPLQQILPETSEKENIIRVPDVSEATHDLARVKEHVSQSGALPVEEVHQKLVASDAGKKVSLPSNAPTSYFSEADTRRTGMLLNMDAYVAPSNFNSYWQGYYLGSTDMPYQNAMPLQSFWSQNYQNPQRYHAADYYPGINVQAPFMYHAADYYPGINVQPPFPSTKGLEVCRANVKSREYISSNANVLTMKSKHKSSQVRRSQSPDHHSDKNREPKRSRKRSLYHDQELDRDDHHRQSSHGRRVSLELYEKGIPRRSSLREPEHFEGANKRERDWEQCGHRHHRPAQSDAPRAELDRKPNAGVSGRISFPEEKTAKRLRESTAVY